MYFGVVELQPTQWLKKSIVFQFSTGKKGGSIVDNLDAT